MRIGRMWKPGGLVAGGLLLVGGLVVAASEVYDWGPWFPASATKVIGVTTWYSLDISDNPGPQTDMEVVRGPISATGTFTLQAKATIQAVGVLQAYRLEVGNDANNDATLQIGEWSVLSAASGFTEAGGVTTAQTASVQTDGSHDGFRVVMIRSDLSAPIVEYFLLGEVELASN